MTEITYTQHLFPGTREELLAKIKQQLKPKRFKHVLRVEQTAMKLAQANGVDLEKASIAGLTHDYAKQRPDEDFIDAIHRYAMNPELLNYGNAIWHGVVGAEFVKRELGVTDEDILNAVRHHTTGAVYMTKLEQIVYMADFIEPARDFPGVDEARKLTDQQLELGVAYQSKHTLAYLVATSKPVYPQSIIAYNAWIRRYPNV
ncbi:MAG TPA: bis(5'-nucleosyl)-tetraphosphatase (symmetrical) YqeK [Candidatus Levilactobacillus faecigallinarum]|uniref:bis(5'-nucleosyl)-tetraphosphatase (symmetrical) n=1 Tax=Candidatus Levilactobacillus faecigallinarum TaxID=2838638 RepID=A0A9D1QQQ9_9LACO|nr:bis(5'-nucleosyl)-tetraphosphatase (symmetrical) YqeK [Candidatus Levilactobacillus faecigallinarum]